MGDDITIGVTEIVNNIEVTAQPNDQIIDISVVDNSDEVTLNITPTVVEVNINKGSSYARWGTIYGNLTDQLDLSNALLLKADLVDGKVPAYQLPSFVDDVIEVANYAALPAIGEIGKIYVTLDNNKIYRWGGSIYVEIAANQAIWGSITGTLSSQSDLQSALNAKQNALSGTGFVKISGTTISYDNNTYALDSNVVHLTGDETISGRKTFNSSTDIGIRSNNSGNGYGIYSENASNGFGLYVANNGSGKAIKVANALGSFGNMFEGSYNGTTNFYVNSQGMGYFSNYLTLDSSFFLKQDSNLAFSSGYTTIDTDSGGLYVGLNSSKLAYLNLNNITTQRNFTFPDLNGTFALGTGTTNYLAKWSNGNTITNSVIYDNGTNVGFGTTNASGRIALNNPVSDGSVPLISIRDTSNVYEVGYLNFNQSTDMMTLMNKQSYSASGISFGTNNTERMRITSGGDVLVNSTSNTLGGKLASTLNDNGYAISALKQGTFGAAILARVDNTNSDFCRFWYSSSNTQVGSISTNGTTTSYNVTSDYRLKQDFKQFNGLDLISKIKVYDYEWKSDKSRMNGVIAHELQEVVPYAVNGEKDAEQMQGVDYSKLVPILVQAIQELKAEIELLKAK